MVQAMQPETQLLKVLGFPDLRFHAAFNHFDFRRGGRRILVIGPMGSGKTEYSARVWRDSLVALRKSGGVAALTSTAGADRRKVFFIRSLLDRERFPQYPRDALPYRNGFERCGENIADIRDSFELEAILARRPEVGTWIIDEASFYEERLAYVVANDSQARGTVFIFPTLILNFRRELFNATSRLLLDTATDLFPLTAFCEHPDCLEDSLYTYRYYLVGGEECPALYFDPLIIVGGDQTKTDPREPNYCTRCDAHHYLPGKEYTFLILKPLGEKAAGGDLAPLRAGAGLPGRRHGALRAGPPPGRPRRRAEFSATPWRSPASPRRPWPSCTASRTCSRASRCWTWSASWAWTAPIWKSASRTTGACCEPSRGPPPAPSCPRAAGRAGPPGRLASGRRPAGLLRRQASRRSCACSGR